MFVHVAFELFVPIVLCLMFYISGYPLTEEIIPLLSVIFIFSILFSDYKSALRYVDYRAVKSYLFKALGVVCILIVFDYIFSMSLSIQNVLFFISINTFVQLLLNNLIISFNKKLYDNRSKKNVIVYGAGDAGIQIGRALDNDQAYKLIAYIDDNINKCGQKISSIKIYHSSEISNLISKYKVEIVYVTLPSIESKALDKIVTELSEYSGVEILVLPKLFSKNKNVFLSDLFSADINKLLGREEVPPKLDLLDKDIKSKCVLVTGAGGSIGSEICRCIAAREPKLLVLLDSSEHALYQISKELNKLYEEKSTVNFSIQLGSVLDLDFLNEIFANYSFDTVYHAAAYKHVPIVEDNIVSGVKNNIVGTMNMAEVSKQNNVHKFVLISTDKAVRPTNVMGATKRFAELILQNFAEESSCSTIFTMVRFGNVLGSSGSVVPLFQEQIRNGGPVTLTHKDVTRYFMTIPEAASLVIQAGAISNGGEVYLLDMGNSVRIYDLAEKMILQSGNKIKVLNSNEGIEIKVTGLRPGEKLFEELLIDAEASKTEHERILKANEKFLSAEEFTVFYQELFEAINNCKKEKIISILEKCVSGYSYYKARD